MSTVNLRADLQALEIKLRLPTAEANVFHAEVIPGCEWARLAVGVNGLALMLPKLSGTTLSAVSLPNIEVRFNVQPQVETDGAFTFEEIVFVETKSNDEGVQRAFLDVVTMLLASGRYGHAADVRQLIEDFMELFRSLESAPCNSALGLWGELLTLSEASEVDTVSRGWHSASNDRFDFSLVDLRIETKTVIGPRVHHFSYEQLVPLADVQIVIVSIVTAQDSQGPSIADLLDRVVGRTIDPSVKALAIKLAMASLGSDWSSQSTLRFDETLAKSSTRWFCASAVPKVAPPPLEVSAIEFVSDLQIIRSLSKEDVQWEVVAKYLG